MYGRSCFLYLIISTWVLLLCSCKESKPKKDTGDIKDQIVATYKSNKLFYSDIEPMISSFTSSEDSTNLVSGAIDRWTKEVIFLEEAKRVIDQNEILDLVEDYKNSLILDRFENKLITEKLDTLISDQELLKYYNSNKSEYKLDGPIIRMLFAKFSKPQKEQKMFEDLWSNPTNSNLLQLQKFCQNNAETSLLKPDKWQKWNDIQNNFPDRLISLNTLYKGMNRQFADFKYVYYTKVIDIVLPNQDPPLSFVKEQARESILHQRKINLINQFKIQFYENQLKQKNIK